MLDQTNNFVNKPYGICIPFWTELDNGW